MTDCKECMKAYTKATRQGWGCGYELAPAANVPVMPWSGGFGYEGPAPTVCAGYTTALPETIEIARAWMWWRKSQLEAFVDGARVSGPLKHGIEMFDGVISGFERWKMTPKDNGGGAE